MRGQDRSKRSSIPQTEFPTWAPGPSGWNRAPSTEGPGLCGAKGGGRAPRWCGPLEATWLRDALGSSGGLLSSTWRPAQPTPDKARAAAPHLPSPGLSSPSDPGAGWATEAGRWTCPWGTAHLWPSCRLSLIHPPLLWASVSAPGTMLSLPSRTGEGRPDGFGKGRGLQLAASPQPDLTARRSAPPTPCLRPTQGW